LEKAKFNISHDGAEFNNFPSYSKAIAGTKVTYI
jgi:hypothetical protein